MNCLLIGGSGFIGSNLARKLVQSGRSVTSLSRGGGAHQAGLEHVKYVQGDYSDLHLIEQLVAKHDEIIHLAYATVPNTSFDNPVADLNQNLQASIQLFDVVAKQGTRLMLVSSGGTVYGEALSTPIAENHSTNPISPYGVTKLTLEKYAYLYAVTRGLKVVCVRPANPYGEGQKPFVGQGFIATVLATALQNKPITVFGKQGTVRDYLHIDDLVEGMITVLDKGKDQGIYNIGSGIGLNNMQILDVFAPLLKELNIQLDVHHVPERAFDVKVNILDCAKLHQLGWQAIVDIDTGAEKTLQWMQKYMTGRY